MTAAGWAARGAQIVVALGVGGALSLVLACGAGSAEGVAAAEPDPADGGAAASAVARRERARDVASAPATSGSSGAPASASATAALSTSPPPAPIAPILTSDMVRDVVRAHYADLGTCYLQGLERDPKLAGTVAVHLAIDGQGRVVDASAPAAADKKQPPPRRRWRKRRRGPQPKPTEPRITDAEVVSCLLAKMRALRFPPSKRGLTNLVYPLVFATQ